MYVLYSSRMGTHIPPSATLTGAAYAALRHGGAPATSAAAQLGLEPVRAQRFEQLFIRRAGGGEDPMKPAYARHGRHVDAVLAQGGFPVLALLPVGALSKPSPPAGRDAAPKRSPRKGERNTDRRP